MNDDLIASMYSLGKEGLLACGKAADALEAQAKRISELEEALRCALENLERADTSTGYCMCGSSADHSAWEGHTPVDAGVYYACEAIRAARAVLGVTP